ncbi:MAG: tetratricopeptide repeat protein [bacterium]
MPRHRAFRLFALAVGSALAMTPACPGWADTAQPETAPDNAGAYLAARLAAANNDFTAAAYWFEKALLSDPKNPTLLEGAVTSQLALGAIDTAAAYGQILLDTGSHSQIAYIAVLAGDAKAGNFAKVLKDQTAGNSVGSLVDKLVVAWSELGIGKMSEALADFDKVTSGQGTAAFGLYHKALALASTGDFEGADKLLSGPGSEGTQQLRRAVVARLQILSQLERDPDAVALLDKVFGTRLDLSLTDLRARLVAGETLPYDVARTATEGLAEVFFTLATALNDQADQTYVLLYARIATALRPDHVEAQMLSAGLLANLGQNDQAIAAFATVPANDPAYVAAQIGMADVSIRAGRPDDAVVLLQKLATQKHDDLSVQTALGDALRRQGHCDQAVMAYDTAIALLPRPEPGNWPMFYKRAGCEAALNDWPAAQADFIAALKLDPTEPRLLNELGYTYVDRGENLDEALKMIQQAVAGSPNSGYIVDSLAWAYFRMGRYADAVAPQEKASKLMPVDPVVTDHLGDIYWMVGRKREAQFQWRRALSFNPDPKDRGRIIHKLDVGLDKVLSEEKAAAANGN